MPVARRVCGATLDEAKGHFCTHKDDGTDLLASIFGRMVPTEATTNQQGHFP